MDEKIRAEFFSRRFSLMQGTILGQIDEELDDDVFAKLITAYFHTVKSNSRYYAGGIVSKHCIRKRKVISHFRRYFLEL